MSIHQEQVQELNGGFQKEIEASALGMILDNLQISQYQYPIKSTVRELTSNALDAIAERDIARSILEGKAKEEDYYIRRDDPLFKDSNFNPEYFDLNWLSTIPYVELRYIVTDSSSRDQFIVKDYGSGIGPSRLPGYFKLGYSTKRNTKKALGKFGIGAKAGLSTGIDYYEVQTCYNGLKFRFNVYSHKVDPIVPPLSLETGEPNTLVLLNAGEGKEPIRTYAEPTTEKNGTKIILGVKKHKKQDFIDAVTSQLFYFKNVRLFLEEDGNQEEFEVNSTIFYEDEFLILSDNTVYSKPHLVVNGVNYGVVDFEELELNSRQGNVGIKVALEDIEVTPSRESVIWSEKTKTALLQRFEDATISANRIIEKEMKDTDFVKWLTKLTGLRSFKGNVMIANLKEILKKDSINPEYIGLPGVPAFSENMFPGLVVAMFEIKEEVKGGKKQRVLDKVVTGPSNFEQGTPVYYVHGRYDTRTVSFLAETHGKVIVVCAPKDLDAHTNPEETDEDWFAKFEFHRWWNKVREDKMNFVKTKYTKLYDSELSLPEDRSKFVDKDRALEVFITRRKKVMEAFKASAYINDFSKVEIPRGWSLEAKEKTNEEEKGKGSKTKSDISPAEKRRLESKTVANVLRNYPKWFSITTEKLNTHSLPLFEWQKVEPKLEVVEELEGEEIYYGTQQDEANLHFASILLDPHSLGGDAEKVDTTDEEKLYFGFDGKSKKNYDLVRNYGKGVDLTLVRIAKENIPVWSNYKHINEFFFRIENNNTITMSKLLQQWTTARVINEHIGKLKFMQQYNHFDPEIAEKYRTLKDYWLIHYKSVEGLLESGAYFGANKEVYKELIEFHDKLISLQLVQEQFPEDKELIASKVQEVFGLEGIEQIGVIDMGMYKILYELLDYAEPVYTLLNHIEHMTQAGRHISPALEQEIKAYLKLKGR